MAATRSQLAALLEAVACGDLDADAAADRIVSAGLADLGFARLDLQRELRQGAPEAVLGAGKTPAQVVAIVRAMVEGGAGSVLVTRADDAMRAAVRDAFAEAREDARARAIWVARELPEPRGLVALVSAGTSDGPALHEARIRAELLGAHVVVHEDCGVAGLHRLAAVVPDLVRADCVVVVAGMDGALASVVGGLVAAPVIGVPTSVGYGSARGGETALHAMLTSCAAGLAVVGIDDGLGAGTIAARIARAAAGAPAAVHDPAADGPSPAASAAPAPARARDTHGPALGGEVSPRHPLRTLPADPSREANGRVEIP